MEFNKKEHIVAWKAVIDENKVILCRLLRIRSKWKDSGKDLTLIDHTIVTAKEDIIKLRKHIEELINE